MLRDATQEDYDYLASHSVSRGLKEQPAQTDFVYALDFGDVLLGVGGIKLLTPTVAWCWMDWTDHALEHKIFMYRVVKEWLDVMWSTHNLRRLMAVVEPDFREAIKTVEHLGFVKECDMPHFFGDKHGIMFARCM